MMKKLIIIVPLFLNIVIIAQVGINNVTPKTTVDITAKTTDGSKPEGLIAPRLTGDQIQADDANYGAAQTGNIIYATAAATAPSTKTANITAAGYYFFDGTVWQKFISATAATPVTPKLILSVRRSSNFTGTAGVTNVIPWNSETYDAENAFTPGSSQYTVQKAGIHQIFVNATVDGASFPIGSSWFLRILKNNVVIAAIDATKASGASSNVFAIESCNVGDLISVDFGTAPNVASANLTKLSIFRFE